MAVMALHNFVALMAVLPVPPTLPSLALPYIICTTCKQMKALIYRYAHAAGECGLSMEIITTIVSLFLLSFISPYFYIELFGDGHGLPKESGCVMSWSRTFSNSWYGKQPKSYDYNLLFWITMLI